MKARTIRAAAVLGSLVFAMLATSGHPNVAAAHEGHGFSAGEPGDPRKPSRTVKVSMREVGRKMLFEPARIEVRKGEQIRFMLSNDGVFNHEFVLSTVVENRKHAALMRRFPNMEHEDPNALTLTPFASGELLWRFTRAGEFEFACLISGHYEAGMHGRIVVK